eukprot:TRINITY_DN8224_c0_g1_i3.p1 TRINITY_DN8224_c0_g1~~TRINITY_DN8224_c0_g1_i3.p1  ORF type:complete len:106 (+),score=14.25 TRINITY_DN8224_c0_g1_i3:319-636(+)
MFLSEEEPVITSVNEVTSTSCDDETEDQFSSKASISKASKLYNFKRVGSTTKRLSTVFVRRIDLLLPEGSKPSSYLLPANFLSVLSKKLSISFICRMRNCTFTVP